MTDHVSRGEMLALVLGLLVFCAVAWCVTIWIVWQVLLLAAA